MAPQKVNFGALESYSGGFSLPEGDYAIEFNVVMFAGTKQDGSKAGPERLGVMLDCHPLAGGDKLQQFLSMGSKADQSYAPDPETGKGIVPVPGGPVTNFNNKTNWFMFLKSLYDCGLPPGIFENDLTVLDGVHVHVQNIPEPEDRKGFGSRTGEQEVERKDKTIPVVTEIKDDGKPWEGTGGIPDAAEEKPKATPKAAAKTPVKASPKAVVKAAPVVAAVSDDEDLKAAALTAAATVLEKNPTGCAKVALRTGIFKAIKDEALGNLVLETFFASEDVLNGLIGDLGYKASGMMVKPV